MQSTPPMTPADPVEPEAEIQPNAADAHLVAKAQTGDSDALDLLFRKHYATMLDLARRRLGPRLRQKEEADDLAQTTLREATRDIGAYQDRGDGSFLRWLARILQNKIRDRAEFYAAGKRDISRERSADDTGGEEGGRRLELPSEDLSVTRFVRRSEEHGILREALEELTPDHHQAIALVFFQGLTLRAAGEQMGGRSEDAVRMLLRRAEERLRKLTRARLGD